MREGEADQIGEEARGQANVVSNVDVADATEVRSPLRRSKRRQIRLEEEEDLEAEVPAPDIDDDCAVQGDEDCDEVDDAVDNGEEEAQDAVEDTAGLGVEEDGNLDIDRDFPEANREEKEASDNDSGDDIWDEDKIPDPLSSDDEDDDRVEEARNDLGDPEVLLALEKTYNSPEDFKLALLMYSLKTRYDIKLYKSEAMVVAAKCVYVSDEGVECPWRVRCSYEKSKHKMQIRTYVNEHTCVRSGYSKMLKVSSIGFLFEERLRVNPKLTKHEMVAEIMREYKLEVTPDQCAKAKTKVLRAKRASHDSHFARIWDYQAEVLLRNPGTEFNIETVAGPVIGSKQRFYRLYICFQAQRESWKQTCRPVIGIDGAFLKWDIKGHLLAAVGRDGDNRIVPIAWAVVEIENDDNWDWFLRQLATSLGLSEMTDLAIISDKQSGLVKAIHTILPQAEHRQCSKHIMDNWKRDSHDIELQRLFWKIARSYTVEEFNNYMADLKRYNIQAYTSLQLTSPVTWSRAFFRTGTCCNDNLNNLSESFNRTIRQARRKPVLDLLEDIRRQCMVRTAKRFIIADRCKTKFTPRAHAEIEKMIAGVQNTQRYMSRDNLHEIYVNGVGYFVDMDLKTCGCRKWQMVGIPCVHATCVIIGKREKVESYVNDYYTRNRWRETYFRGIRPVQGMPLWGRLNRLPVLPPPWRRGNAGRPSNYARRKGRNEVASSSNPTKMSREKRIMTCSNCLQEGHNKQSCKNATVLSPPPRPRGRPRINQEPQGHVEGSQGHGSQGVDNGSQGVDNGSQGQNNGSQTQTQRGRGRGTQRHLRTARGAQRQRGRGRGTSQVSEQPAADRRHGTAQPQPQVEAQPQGLAGLG
ncbi:MULE transposase domain [Arabidopsis thaliana x Arabidopsis arenosa]|uniref:MULE transposase domain n=1 Tax=Arabidopsis thaliana x Arabidopsis arenosa TaxID=1240361 RepID=A0A8T2CAA0_9BRAS|nr:MULE transposase domain [Arabidopsis thaliana x Arabidopsis arenosa]